MKSVYYEVEYKPFDMCGSRFYPDEEDRKYRSMRAAMLRADEIKANGFNIEATRVVKVTREPISRREIRRILKNEN